MNIAIFWFIIKWLNVIKMLQTVVYEYGQNSPQKWKLYLYFVGIHSHLGRFRQSYGIMEFLYPINFKRQRSRIFPMTLILYAVCLIWWLKENCVRNILKMWLKIFCPMVARKSYHFPKNLMIRYLWHNHCHKNLQIS